MQTEDSTSTPFAEYRQVLAYVNERNPARAKYKNLLETESRSTQLIADFTGSSPCDIYASAVNGIKRVLTRFPLQRHHAWILRNYGPRDRQCSVEDIAYYYHRSTRTIHRWLDGIDDDMQAEFIHRELIPQI